MRISLAQSVARVSPLNERDLHGLSGRGLGGERQSYNVGSGRAMQCLSFSSGTVSFVGHAGWSQRRPAAVQCDARPIDCSRISRLSDTP